MSGGRTGGAGGSPGSRVPRSPQELRDQAQGLLRALIARLKESLDDAREASQEKHDEMRADFERRTGRRK